VVKKRRNKRRAPPPPATRLDERLTALDLDKLEQELTQYLNKKGTTAKAEPAIEPDAPKASVVAPSHRPLAVPEAEVTIIRRANTGRSEPHLAEPEPQPAPSQPPLRREHAPRAPFEGHVEEATVVIIRRAPDGRTP
jgi:hypothetical protein